VNSLFCRWKFPANFVIILQKQTVARRTKMSKMPSCPSCGSEKVIKNGSIHNGKPKFSCKECRRQFVENPSNKIIPK
jgi:transposase-like protein